MTDEHAPSSGGANARNISAQEIQREMATLRSLRRRSASSGGPGALPLDPDLPPPAGLVAHATSPPKSSSGPYTHQHQHYHLHDEAPQTSRTARSPTSPVSPSKFGQAYRPYDHVESHNDRESQFDRFPQSHELDPDKPIMAQGEPRLAGILPSAPTDDPRNLYWVPAHLHPELAPTEFRAFLKAHAHSGPDDPTADEGVEGFAHRGAFMENGAGATLGRSPSWLARAGANGTGMVAGLARRASSLREDSQRPAAPAGSAPPLSIITTQAPAVTLSSGGSLGRKRSMLSRQYHPRANDNIENEPPPLPTHNDTFLTRSRSRSGSHGEGIFGGSMGEQTVTLQELQQLETIADQAAETGDPEVMRTLLKRSLSLSRNTDFIEGHPETAMRLEDQDSPLLLSQTGSIMRRNAGTRRLRDRGSGVGSRLASSRRPKGRNSTDVDDLVPTSPSSSQFNRQANEAVSLAPPASPAIDQTEFTSIDRRPSSGSETSDEMYSAESSTAPGTASHTFDDRRPSDASTEESSIYDAYTSTDTQGDTSVESSTSSTSYGGLDSSTEDLYRAASGREGASSAKLGLDYLDAKHRQAERHEHGYSGHEAEQWESEGERTPTSQVSEDFARFRIVGDEAAQRQGPYAPPSPPETVKSQSHSASEKPASPQQPPRAQPTAPAVSKPVFKIDLAPPPSKLLKPKQSTEKLKVKSEKKGGLFSKNKDKDKSKKSDKKEEKGFLGSLFGSKKKQEDSAPSKFSQEGKATAAALLGTSKSAKSLGLIPMNGASPTSPGFAPYARYPIHVERAVYRLSHIKLANPRRPLYEQVLISNLMFWYLSIINKPAAPPSPQPPAQKEPSTPAEVEKTPASRPGMSRNTTPTAPVAVAKPATPVPAPETAKRTSLTKPEQRGQSRPRSAETPIRSPQYGMQTMQMDQEYGSRNSGSSRTPPSPAPAPAPQHVPQVQPSINRRAAQPNPINTNVGPVQQTPSSPRSHQLAYDEPRGPLVEKPRRTSSNAPPLMENGRRPAPATEHSRSPPPQYPTQPERRESPRPRQYPQHSGPQPGQVFQYPSNMLNVKPGQVFSSGSASPGGIQPGQVFQHPQYNSYYHPQQYEQAEARLPPGAINPRRSSQDRGAQSYTMGGPTAGGDDPSGRRTASSGDAYYQEYSPSGQTGGSRSISASTNVQYDPRAHQARQGGATRTPSPQPPSLNSDPYQYRQQIPGHYDSRR